MVNPCVSITSENALRNFLLCDPVGEFCLILVQGLSIDLTLKLLSKCLICHTLLVATRVAIIEATIVALLMQNWFVV